MNPSLKLMELPAQYKEELGRILDAEESWKKLMVIIPKTLEKGNFQCDISRHNLPKYNTQHFKVLEKFSSERKRSATLILLQDWGTSGEASATLGHLLYLLKKAELFAAADYVAVDLLKQPVPKRPKKGPAAKMIEVPTKTIEDIEKILDEINYPVSVIENMIKTSSNQNKNIIKPMTPPSIVISESPEEEKSPDMFIPVIMQAEYNKINRSGSDMIQFSTTTDDNNSNISDNLPCITGLINESSDMMKFSTNTDSNTPIDNQTGNIPCFTGLIESSTNNESISQFVPQLSDLMDHKTCSSDSQFIPNLSALSQDTDSNIQIDSREGSSPHTSELSSGNIPYLSDLNQSQHTSNEIPNLSELNSSQSSCSNVSSHITSDNSGCDTSIISSQIPRFSELSINTCIPHFTYEELLKSTDNFSMIPSKSGGRFLGSGAFGSVFLATGLLEKPLAVKKLHLQSDKYDMITKQFKNEVEILNTYNHENLISLVGYSCDGLTCCLLYEYLSGGPLSDRLQAKENILTSIERIKIAAGTADGISYLHSAYSTPLIHRDIKSANILLDSNNKPKVCDFGLIKLAPEQTSALTTTIIGTSAYMSPEAFRGDISVKLDTFSFGVVLLELLTSLPPVDDNREGRDIVTHLEAYEDVEPILDMNAGSWIINGINFGDEVYNIAQKCLKNKKEHRPTMVDVKSILNQLIKQMNES